MQNQSDPLVSQRQLDNTLGYSLPAQEYQLCLEQVKFINPKLGKFDVEEGIYIVITGKVRLLFGADEQITTLATGESFGEFFLFKETDLTPYAARAGRNLQLCFVPGDVLFPLVNKYPQIREHLWHTTEVWNHRVVNSNNPPAKANSKIPRNDILSINPPSNKRGSGGEVSKKQKHRKISKAYFPNPTVKVGQLWQRFTRRYPYFQQQSASDCGAACLVMVSRYWGKHFSVNRLREIANVDRNGASFRGLAVAAESIGFTTRPVKARECLQTITTSKYRR